MLREEGDAWGFSADDVNLVCSPLHHSAPIRFAGGTLLAGGSVVVIDRFDVPSFVHAVRTHRPTTAFLVPAHLQRLLAGGVTAEDLASFRLIAHAGAPCSEPLKRAAMVDGAGMIWCEVPPHGRFEYWRDPARTAAAWRPARTPGAHGAFTVGDLGRLDDDG